MKIIYSTVVLFSLLGTSILLGNTNLLIIEKKVIEKSFSVNSDAELRISNRYGNINLTSWDKNTVAFYIEIKIDGKDTRQVKEKINAISIDFTSSKSLVTAETIIKKISGKNKTNIEINYTVKLPKSNNITINNRYGDIILNELNGSSKISLDYGNMKFGNLNNSLNTWDLDYVSKAEVQYMKTALINADYSNLIIENSEILNLMLDYTNVKIGKVKDIINNMDYGNIKIGEVSTITNISDYTTVFVGKLTNSFVSTGDYGSIKIEYVKPNFNKISIGADYSDVNIGIDKNAGYSISGNFKYGGLKYPDNVKMTRQIKKNTTKSYEGECENSSSKILINMSYGSATIKTVN